MDVLRTIWSDHFALIAVQSALAGLLAVSLCGSFRSWLRLKRGAVRATVDRGERTMGMLWAAYGVLAVVCALAVQVAEAFKGFKVSLIVCDYLVLTYLFFFNSWFRNAIAIRCLIRTTKD